MFLTNQNFHAKPYKFPYRPDYIFILYNYRRLVLPISYQQILYFLTEQSFNLQLSKYVLRALYTKYLSKNKSSAQDWHILSYLAFPVSTFSIRHFLRILNVKRTPLISVHQFVFFNLLPNQGNHVSQIHHIFFSKTIQDYQNKLIQKTYEHQLQNLQKQTKHQSHVYQNKNRV